MDSIVDTLFNSISLSFSLDFKDPSSSNFSNQVHCILLLYGFQGEAIFFEAILIYKWLHPLI